MRILLTITLVCAFGLSAYAQEDDYGDDLYGGEESYGSDYGGAPTEAPPAQEPAGGYGGYSGIETQPPMLPPAPEVQAETIDPKSSLAYAPISKGFFMMIRPGAMQTFGGSKSVSDASFYIGLDLGYDLLMMYHENKLSSNLSIGLDIAYAASKGSARIKSEFDDGYYKNYSMFFTNLFLQYQLGVLERLAIPFQLSVGTVMMSPKNNSTFKTQDGLEVRTVDVLGSDYSSTPVSLDVAIKLGIHYYTYMRHVSIGIEVAPTFIIGLSPSHVIPALAEYVVVRYTF